MILCVALNPSIDRTTFIDELKPHDTNRIVRTEMDAGGKGINVARMLTALGTDSVVLAPLGGAEGEMVKHVLQRERVRAEVVEISEATRVNVMIEERSGGPPTTLNEKGPELSGEELSRLNESYRRLVASASHVVLGGSLLSGMDSDVFAAMMRVAKEVGEAKTVVDADGEPMMRCLNERPFLTKPNGAEAGRVLKSPVSSPTDAIAAAEKIAEFGVSISLVSMGSEGCAMFCDGSKYWASAPKVVVKSTIGAGDSLVAGFLSAMTKGCSRTDCLALGVAAGAATAMSDGASIGDEMQVRNLLERVSVERVN